MKSTLIEALGGEIPDAAAALKLLNSASTHWLSGERAIEDDAEIAVRLFARADDLEEVLPGAKTIIQAIGREAGLFPYLDEVSITRDEIALETHRVPGLDDTVFHSEQLRVFRKLASGKNVILSAPTSFGKTLLVDALIAHRQPKLAVIVVPTIALLEERRRTIVDRFTDYDVISQNFQAITDQKTIVIGTQERIFDRTDLHKPDLFVIDEFYKLDLTRGDTRANTLHALLARYIDQSRQVYLLGPSLPDNPVNTKERPDFEFVKTKYSPVAADVISVEPQGTDPDVLAKYLHEEAEASRLIYCQSPRSARDLSRELIQRKVGRPTKTVKRIADWLRQNYHDGWYVADALEQGIGIHHGRVPRAIAHLMVSLFNQRKIGILICTSSLIEGVNTTAEVVFIYDKKISTRKLDRFTFDNIKGRAGRMFRHFIGRIYLFNEAPHEIWDPLDIPLLQDRSRISDRDLFQVPEEHLTDTNLRRKAEFIENSPLPTKLLEKYARYGVGDIELCYNELEEMLSTGSRKILWTGLKGYKEILASMEIIWGRIQFDKHGVHSARQFAFFANKLQYSKSIRSFLEKIVSEDNTDEDIDLAFNFLRGVEYSFVQPLEFVQDIAEEILGKAGEIDYSVFLARISSWGLQGHSKALEEVGIPEPIIRKLEGFIDTFDIDAAVAETRRLMESGTILSDNDVLVLDFTLGSRR
ncbi:DEAD/DEAH box helicase [Maricaulis sp.]|uniref:DEAD/DEAH box helicase n=1 Tax=Maricaulis sp. TaxID=1486257 RepID=UPI001B2C5F93|nr:DEAD/DEAH box helicase [Maricaulis sp.]MBO6765597.1 DEAD/DEAH box helicase [Maricaulis sp.]